MPCGDLCDYPGVRVDPDEYRVLVRLACEYLTMLEKCGGPAIPDYAKSFWDKHKIEDKRRANAAAAQDLRSEQARQALSKLSQKEREALGLG